MICCNNLVQLLTFAFHFQELFQNSSMQLSGPIRFAHQWIDMSKRKVIKISQIQLSFFFTDRKTSFSDTIDFVTRLYWYTAVETTDRGFLEVFWQIYWGGSLEIVKNIKRGPRGCDSLHLYYQKISGSTWGVLFLPPVCFYAHLK